MKLSQILPGEAVIVEQITDHELSTKLYEMGILPGELVLVKFKAPFGDPMAVSVAGYTLAIRMNEAERVVVKKV